MRAINIHFAEKNSKHYLQHTCTYTHNIHWEHFHILWGMGNYLCWLTSQFPPFSPLWLGSC